jgi:WD40 repeat protein
VYDSDEGAGGMDDASTVASNDAAILLDDSSANFVGHTDAVYWSAFHPSNSTIVVTASGDDTAGVWNSETNAMVLQLRGHTDTVNWAAFNATGTLIATARYRSLSRNHSQASPPLQPGLHRQGVGCRHRSAPPRLRRPFR